MYRNDIIAERKLDFSLAMNWNINVPWHYIKLLHGDAKAIKLTNYVQPYSLAIKDILKPKYIMIHFHKVYSK